MRKLNAAMRSLVHSHAVRSATVAAPNPSADGVFAATASWRHELTVPRASCCSLARASKLCTFEASTFLVSPLHTCMWLQLAEASHSTCQDSAHATQPAAAVFHHRQSPVSAALAGSVPRNASLQVSALQLEMDVPTQVGLFGRRI